MESMIKHKRILVVMLIIVLAFGAMSTVLAEKSKPEINFTSSGVTFNKEAKLLRFNLKWSHPEKKAINVMYSIDNNEAKKLGTYKNQDDQIIAHIYLEAEELSGGILSIYAEDGSGNKSAVISSEFQITSTHGIRIDDEPVPLSAGEGTWSLINLFLAALSVAMVAVSIMLFIENRSIENFRHSGKVRSLLLLFLTLALAGGNITVLITTQNLKHQMVMFDDMTIAMLVVTVLSIVTTMILTARAYHVQSERKKSEFSQ